MCILSLSKCLIGTVSLPFKRKTVLSTILFLSDWVHLLRVWVCGWKLACLCASERGAPGGTSAEHLQGRLGSWFPICSYHSPTGCHEPCIRVGFGPRQGEPGLCFPSGRVSGLLRLRFPRPLGSANPWVWSLRTRAAFLRKSDRRLSG